MATQSEGNPDCDTMISVSGRFNTLVYGKRDINAFPDHIEKRHPSFHSSDVGKTTRFELTERNGVINGRRRRTEIMARLRAFPHRDNRRLSENDTIRSCPGRVGRGA